MTVGIMELDQPYKIIASKEQLLELVEHYDDITNHIIFIDAELQRDQRTKENLMISHMLQQSRPKGNTYIFIGNRDSKYSERVLRVTNMFKKVRKINIIVKES